MKKEYKIILIASLLLNFADSLIGPFYSIYIKEIGLSLVEIGMGSTIFCFATGFFIIIIGKLSDKMNKELVTVFGYAFFTIATLFYFILESAWQLYLMRIITAFGVACLAAPLSSLFACFIEKDKEGSQWGLSDGGSYLAAGLAVLVGTLIVNYWGYVYVFSIMLFIDIIAFLIQLKFYFTRKNEICLKQEYEKLQTKI